jgi:hypothetical protein
MPLQTLDVKLLDVKPEWRRHPDRAERAPDVHPNREPVTRMIHPVRSARERLAIRRSERRG